MADENIYLKKAIDLPEYTGDIDDVDLIAVKTSDGYMKRVKTATTIGTIATKADKVSNATAGDVVTLDSDGNIEDSGVALDQLAKVDGSYSSMAVGVADNLAGRGSVAAKYTFRTSGGSEDIGTGTATVKEWRGNTIVWNQLVDTDTTSVTPISGHKYYTLINGTASIITSDGTAIAVTGGTDMVVDLTLAFGSGNEPSTTAEFQALYPLNHYDYNAGELVNNTASAIKTIGFNQWDEQWELGDISRTGDNIGQNITASNVIRSKNYIPVFPSLTYFVNKNLFIYEYDAEHNFVFVAVRNNTTFELQPQTAFIRFVTRDATTTYNNDICINLSWSGYRNGEYEAYSETTTYINGANGSLATLTGKLNGEGESVTVFPNGTCSAGTAYDKVKGNIATKVIGSVDMGDLTWSLVYGGVFSTPATFIKNYGSSVAANILSAKFTTSAFSGGMSVGKIALTGGGNLYISTNYSTVSEVESAMQGVTLYYELATTEEYTLDTTPAYSYPVNDFGTEQALPASTASSVVAPILYEVQYALNATDQIRRLPENYISKKSFENFCTELASKLGTALNSTITITATYDSTDAEYDYSISIVANE